MKKKWLGVMTSALVLMSLVAGCGNSATSNDKEIRIGGNFELTGGVADYGKQSLNGIMLAIKEANDAGGVLGKKIVLVQADNKSEASEAANAATKLITQDKVSAMLGPITSSNAIAALQISQDNKVPLVTPTGTNTKITVDDNGQVRPYAFRGCFIDPFQGIVMANFATKTLHAKTAVIYIDSSSDYSKNLAESFTESFTKNGGQIIGKEAFLQKDQDFKATLTKIKSLNADIIFIPAYYEEVGKIVKQARELGINVPLLGTDGWDNAKITEIAGAGPLNNTFFSNHYSAEDKDPRVVKFVEDYKKEYNEAPSAFSALGYDTALMLIDAIKRAGSDDPEKIREALEKTKDLQVVTGILTLDANHNPIKSAVVVEMKDGKQVFKEKVNP
ncbi:ABC transporter substrate-binding protein [Propionispora hippei]|uniref:Branched-chain amino acid transport system substrate-binding protein n=1 Tax=Propionispora hippei DSM 15287 TaxID=1123003 RepID=A0A1M6KL21_9FIRM|nr:ABC transporter substrate-binding protein [Propionispora hippei]SHJ59667.1 branched-chain amino acid transport system substrate-binding protein [Propionispora hippei DSM 15287]